MRNRKSVLSRAGSFGWLTRCVAAFMLTLLLPAAVLAAPLGYCMGKNGHRAIEFVHVKVSFHANSARNDGASLEGRSHDPRAFGAFCLDRLLLPVVAKWKSCDAPRPNSDAIVSNCFRGDLRARFQPRSHLMLRLALLHRPQPDPRLAALRTVVLLN